MIGLGLGTVTVLMHWLQYMKPQLESHMTSCHDNLEHMRAHLSNIVIAFVEPTRQLLGKWVMIAWRTLALGFQDKSDILVAVRDVERFT